MRVGLNARTYFIVALFLFGVALSGCLGYQFAEIRSLREELELQRELHYTDEARRLLQIRQLKAMVASEIARLDELQEWRVTITLASRKGWGAANRYISRQWEFMPEEWRYAERNKHRVE